MRTVTIVALHISERDIQPFSSFHIMIQHVCHNVHWSWHCRNSSYTLWVRRPPVTGQLHTWHRFPGRFERSGIGLFARTLKSFLLGLSMIMLLKPVCIKKLLQACKRECQLMVPESSTCKIILENQS